jgi:predicted small secreted protein
MHSNIDAAQVLPRRRISSQPQATSEFVLLRACIAALLLSCMVVSSCLLVSGSGFTISSLPLVASAACPGARHLAFNPVNAHLYVACAEGTDIT